MEHADIEPLPELMGWSRLDGVRCESCGLEYLTPKGSEQMEARFNLSSVDPTGNYSTPILLTDAETWTV